MPLGIFFTFKITAAATTGPASGPRPASSMPATMPGQPAPALYNNGYPMLPGSPGASGAQPAMPAYGNYGAQGMAPAYGTQRPTRISRRTLLQTSVIFAASLALPRAVFAQDAKTIVWGKSIEVSMIDPHTALVGSAWQLQYLVYETLVQMGDNYEPLPGLAESWDTPSPTTYVFHLRDGVKFSNGRAMTADDDPVLVMRRAMLLSEGRIAEGSYPVRSRSIASATRSGGSSIGADVGIANPVGAEGGAPHERSATRTKRLKERLPSATARGRRHADDRS